MRKKKILLLEKDEQLKVIPLKSQFVETTRFQYFLFLDAFSWCWIILTKLKRNYTWAHREQEIRQTEPHSLFVFRYISYL